MKTLPLVCARPVVYGRSKTTSDSIQRDGVSICDRQPGLVWSQILDLHRREIWVNVEENLVHLAKI